MVDSAENFEEHLFEYGVRRFRIGRLINAVKYLCPFWVLVCGAIHLQMIEGQNDEYVTRWNNSRVLLNNYMQKEQRFRADESNLVYKAQAKEAFFVYFEYINELSIYIAEHPNIPYQSVRLRDIQYEIERVRCLTLAFD